MQVQTIERTVINFPVSYTMTDYETREKKEADIKYFRNQRIFGFVGIITGIAFAFGLHAAEPLLLTFIGIVVAVTKERAVFF